MMKKANAFSDESRSIFILVHSKLFINDSEKLQYFFNAAKLNRIEICFTPFNQAETSIEIPEYVQFCKYFPGLYRSKSKSTTHGAKNDALRVMSVFWALGE